MSGDRELVEKLARARASIREQISQVIVGQDEVIEQMLVALFCRGHVLIVGVPGLAKTLMVQTLADILDLQFSRIQFTPDLMPSDITGTEVIQEVGGQRSFRFVPGPIFANVVLADEINRTPPKTQAALLQAMQEYRVTAGGKTYPTPLPFFVLATRNPIEMAGTYELPEAQLDRFFFEIRMDYPSFEEEKEIVERTTSARSFQVRKVLSAAEILALQEIVRKVPVPASTLEYAVRLASMTRPGGSRDGAPEQIRKYVAWGAGPRASQALVLAAKARAVLSGRFAVSAEDIRAAAGPVLRHRIVRNFSAEADGVTADDLIRRLLETCPY